MDTDLPLTSFEVEGYRGIRHLQLPELGRVNLFVGKNNAGKTSLLEAVRIHAEQNPVSAIGNFLRDRANYNSLRHRFLTGGDSIDEEDLLQAFRLAENLFFREDAEYDQPRIAFRATGGLGGETRLSLPWWSPKGERTTSPAIFGSVDDPLVSVDRAEGVTSLSLRGFFGMFAPRDAEVLLVGSGGLDGKSLTSYWSRIAALGHAALVEEAFRQFLPGTKRILLLSSAGGFGPSIAVETDYASLPVPLVELGDGTRRVLGIILAMLNTANGVLLVDEVENGLHYTVQHDVWDAIFSLAEKLNVQIFATTHSWETVVAFQYSANRFDSEGMLYRLDRQEDGRIRDVRYTEEEVAIAAEQEIEVR
jgi:hypothetical protein